MGATQQVTATDFDSEVLQADKVLVDFWGHGCPPCDQIAPYIDELAGELAGKVKVVKANLEENFDFAVGAGIMSIPTLVFFKNGEEVGRMVGAYPKATIAAEIDKLLG